LYSGVKINDTVTGELICTLADSDAVALVRFHAACAQQGR
jgi:hypothetical protein